MRAGFTALSFAVCSAWFRGGGYADPIVEDANSGRSQSGMSLCPLFAHFCAGENEQDIQPVLRKLEAAGVGTILDYAAEKDIIEDSGPGLRYVSPSIKCANVRFCERHGMQPFFVVSLPSFLPPCSASSSQCASALRGAPPPCVQGRCSRSRICGRTTVRLQCKFGAGLHRYRLQVFPT